MIYQVTLAQIPKADVKGFIEDDFIDRKITKDEMLKKVELFGPYGFKPIANNKGILPKLWVDHNSNVIRDEFGNHFLPRGINVAYKAHPFVPKLDEFDSQESLTKEDAIDLRRLGFNFVRLAVYWEALEIEPGVWNQTYLEQLDIIIERLADVGIYTMIDSHQDLMSKIICGEGMPDFYAKMVTNNAKCPFRWSKFIFPNTQKQMGVCKEMKKYNYKTDAQGYPLKSECTKEFFIKYYSTAESLEIFDSLYTNKHNLTDLYMRFYDKIAFHFANNSNIFGFDPLNEPFCSNFMKDVSLLMPRNFDRNKLQPFYTKILQTIRKHDPQAILQFETAQVPNVIGVMGGIVNPSGFTKLPGKQSAFNEHIYCCQMEMSMCQKTGEPRSDPKSGKQCKSFHERRFIQRKKDAETLRSPLIISEFGACYNSEVCWREMNQVINEADKHLAGIAYWQFKKNKDDTTLGGGAQGLYDYDGRPQTIKIKALSRPYQKFTQGELVSQHFDMTTETFSTSFIYDPYLPDGKTEIFVNTRVWFRYLAEKYSGDDSNALDITVKTNFMPVKHKIEYIYDGNFLDSIQIKILNDEANFIQVEIKPKNKNNNNMPFNPSQSDLDQWFTTLIDAGKKVETISHYFQW